MSHKPTPIEKFDTLARAVAQAPKDKVDAKIAKDKAKRIAKRRKKK